jgi:hypothetical protein
MLANASIQNATTLQGLLCAAFGGFPAHFVAWSCPNGRIQAFAGMTRVGLEREMQQMFRGGAIPLSHRIPENLSLRSATLRCCLGPLPGRSVVVLEGRSG